MIGYYFTMFNIFNNLLYMYKVNMSQCTIIFSVSISAGIISSLIISFLLDKFKKFKKFLIVFCDLGVIFQIILTFLLELSESKRFL